MSDVGFIGLGKMGRGMARRLIKAGLTVSVVAHRDRSAVDALVDEGAVQVSSKIQMVETCPTILTCVSDATARPMPRPPPVTIATLPSNRLAISDRLLV